MVRFDFFLFFCLIVKTKSTANFRFNNNQRSGECGWDSCNPTLPDKVNVHLVPHSHDDTGWLKTVDQYYYGAHQEVQRAGVQYILESVIKELARDETKKFIQVETGFLWRWWESKDVFMRNLTLSLINSGQLQFAGGGWSMNDEATTHFLSIINNMEFGINWLKDNLGVCSVPDVAWQIDPFGHSKEQARLFAEMGFKGLFFARIDYRDKAERKNLTELQMIWEGGEPGDLDQSIFTGVFDDHYSAPRGFCWDIICTDEPINDDPSLQEYNVDKRISEFVKIVEEKVKYYKDENHIMFTMGDDFTYQNARQYYKNIDKLIKNMNSRTDETGIHVLYSTPSCYIKSLSEGKVEYPTKSDDFFPYASSPDSYWTGFFSSRPSIKLQERRGMRDLTVSQQLEVASRGSGSSILFNMQRAMGLMQHHDAVTGTEKQHVASDYTKRLHSATLEAQDMNLKIMLDKSGLEHSLPPPDQTLCPNLNVSQCLITEGDGNFIIYVYNPLSHPSSPYIRIPISEPNLSIYTLDGRELTIQVNEIPEHVKRIPSRNSSANYEAIFRLFDVPSLGFTAVYGTKSSIKNPVTQVVKKKNSPTRSNFSAKLQYYEGADGNKTGVSGRRASGAYVFSPAEAGKQDFVSEKYSELVGSLVTESITEYDSWGVLGVRQYVGLDSVEIYWQVGPIPVKDGIGKETVLVYSTDIQSDKKMYTDANGRQMIERSRRIDSLDAFETSNYYPITSRVELRSNEDVFTVLPDRSEGAASLVDGQLELMLHRRLLHDDGYGVGEPLNETETFNGVETGLVAVGEHRLLIGHSLDQARSEMIEHDLPVQLSFLSTQLTLENWLQSSLQEYSGLKKEVPANVQILSLSARNSSTVLLRLYNMMDQEENSEPAYVDLENLFTEFEIVSMEEENLTGASPLSFSKQRAVHWNNNNNNNNNNKRDERGFRSVEDISPVELTPLQIRTFILNVVWN